MISSDFRTEARRKLSGKWGKSICILIAFIVINFLINLVEGFLPDSMDWIGQIINIIINVPLSFGLTFAFLKLFKDEEVKSFDFLKLGFSNFGKSWGITFHTFLKMILPILLEIFSYVLIVVGLVMYYGSTKYTVDISPLSSIPNGVSLAMLIIGFVLFVISTIWSATKSYYYQLAFFISMENEDMEPADAVSESEKLMSGKRASLFCLQLSFIGWAILTAITFGIGLLWLVPYVQFATIAFYKYAIGKNENVEADLDK